MPHTSLMNTRAVTPTGSFQLHPIGNLLGIPVLYHVHANTLCTCCLGNKLPYHVLQLPLQFGQPIHLPNEMG